MSNTLLKVRQLQKSFGAVEACCNINLEINKGEIHALIGPNGAGKTTLIQQLAGQMLPDSGSIEFDGQDITRLPAHKRALLGLARSFQITSIFGQMSAEENIALAVQAHMGHSFRFWRPANKNKKLQPTIETALEKCGLLERRHIVADNLSHGEKRQLEAGMALAVTPKLLMLDEPMAGMGPGSAVKMTELIQSIKGNTSILLVEHDMHAVFNLADRITVLVYGKPIATGTPEEISHNQDVRSAYLGEGDN
ncbi:MAG: ABC transporter ATP-binding protein [SAR324 cluster bacterium]|nr:ABC transporter ATP-binding protein [SAR324 cluster bacterium]